MDINKLVVITFIYSILNIVCSVIIIINPAYINCIMEGKKGRILFVENPSQYEKKDQNNETERGREFRRYFGGRNYEVDFIRGLNEFAVQGKIEEKSYRAMVTHLFAMNMEEGREYSFSFLRINGLKRLHEKKHNSDLKVIVYTGANIEGINGFSQDKILGIIGKSNDFRKDFSLIEDLLKKV